MSAFIEKIKSANKIQLLAIGLVIVGLGFMVWKGLGLYGFSEEANYAFKNNFQAGNPSPDLLRPWMTIRYISMGYAVPQQYIFDKLEIQPKKETSMLSLERLNNHMHLGEIDNQPVLLQKMKDVIIAYRANPVATGLIERYVEDWMSIQYISNSIGVPVSEILNQLGLPLDTNLYLPIGNISNTINYPGGKTALNQALQKIVDANKVKP